MGNANEKFKKNSRSNLKYYLEQEDNLRLLTTNTINTIFVNNLNKMNVLSMFQANNINEMQIERKNESNVSHDYKNDISNFLALKLDNVKYINMMNDTIDKNIQGDINIKRYSDGSYEEMLVAYEQHYKAIIASNEKPNKTFRENTFNSSFNNNSKNEYLFETYVRPESSREVYSDSNFTSTIKASKVNESLNAMNTISTSSNSLTYKSNKQMKVIKIGRKEEFTLSGSKEKNNTNKRNQMTQRASSPIQVNYSINKDDNDRNNLLQTATAKSPISHQINQKVIEVNTDSRVKHQQKNSKAITHKTNNSIMQINKSSTYKDNHNPNTEKSLSPRQKYSLQIPIPKQKKTSISPPTSHHNSINTMLSSSPFDFIVPPQHNSNTSSLSTFTSSYVSLMKQKQKITQGNIDKDSLKVNDSKNQKNKHHLTVKGNLTKSNNKQKSPQRKNEGQKEDKRPLSKPKMTFELDLSDDDNDKTNCIYPCPKPSEQPIMPNLSYPNDIIGEQAAKTQAQTDTQSNVNKSKVKHESIPNCNIMVYKTSDKLQKLKDLKNKQTEFKQPSSFSINIGNYQDNHLKQLVNDNQHLVNLESIKEENRNRSRSLSQVNHSSSSERFSFRKAKPSTDTFETNKGNSSDKEKANNNKEVEPYLLNSSKLLKLQFKVNSNINMNAFDDINFVN